jgi:hypothetical protein
VSNLMPQCTMHNQVYLLGFASSVSFFLSDSCNLLTDGVVDALVHRWSITQAKKDFKMHEERSKNNG